MIITDPVQVNRVLADRRTDGQTEPNGHWDKGGDDETETIDNETSIKPFKTFTSRLFHISNWMVSFET